MKFRNDDFHKKENRELADAVQEEHPKQLFTVAEQRIMAMHRHDDGTPVRLHELGASEIFISSNLEGKLGTLGNTARAKTEADESWQQQMQEAQNAGNAGSSEKIQYERNSKQGGGLTYGHETAKFDNVAFVNQNNGQETFMMGCNCGLEWTVTGQNTKGNNPNNPAATVKIEQYGSPAGGAGSAGYNVSGAGGERQKYNVSGSQQQDYRG